MDMIKTVNSLGLLSGSSQYGVDAALVTTDGVDLYEFGSAQTTPYDDALRDNIRALFAASPEAPGYEELYQRVDDEYTRFQAEIARDYISAHETKVDVIGFEGLTLFNNADMRKIRQLGNGKLLAELTGVRVVNNFHTADIRAGGQGEPLESVYHNALCADVGKPLAVVNISGISRVTWIGSFGEMIAFDTGPGNAAINEWVLKHAGMHMDYNGKLAITGKVNEQLVATMMRHKYFGKYPPKSIDRRAFVEKLEHLEGLNLEDGAATATAFVAESIAYSLLMYLPEVPKIVIVCGGGAKNPTLMRFLRQRLPDMVVKTAAEEGFNTNALEAQAVAYMAVRRLYNLPISFPSTTGVPEPMSGGEICDPENSCRD